MNTKENYKEPMYVIETHFRGDPENETGERCHFRRYVVDIYLENASAKSGKFKLNTGSGKLYYLGHVPVDSILAKIDAPVIETMDAGVEYFATPYIIVEWNSESVVKVTNERKKIARIMLCLSKWGMNGNEVLNLPTDEIVSPVENEATADGKTIKISGNNYLGIRKEELTDAPQSTDVEADAEEDVLSRFAVLADAHIGSRYVDEGVWDGIDWIDTVYENICKIHSENPLDFVLELGDNIDDGYAPTYEPDYKMYLEKIKKLEICDPVNPIFGREEGKIPHYELQGNHDTSMDTRFFRQKLWYTENKNGEKVAYIAFFTDYGGYPLVRYEVAGNYSAYKSYGKLSEDMVDFVEKSIIEAKKNGAKHIILANHFGIAQDSGAPILPETGLGKVALLCKKYNIKLYFSGHEHDVPFTLRKYDDIYNYDVSMTKDKYAIVEITTHHAKVTIYNTADNSVYRVDNISLS